MLRFAKTAVIVVMSASSNHKSDSELYRELSDDKRTAEDAFAEIYRRYSSRTFAYCHRILGSYEQAQDAFQETFTRFYKTAQTERQVYNIPAFLLRIARNYCLNILQRHPRAEETAQLLEEIHTSVEPESLEKRELLKLITMALELLPDNLREAFVLREYDGLSYAEIGEITNTDSKNAKVRVFRAKQRIREILAPYLEDLSKT